MLSVVLIVMFFAVVAINTGARPAQPQDPVRPPAEDCDGVPQGLSSGPRPRYRHQGQSEGGSGRRSQETQQA